MNPSMAATTPEAAAYCLDEKKLMELRELVEEDDAAEAEAALEEDFRALLSMAADLEEEEGLTPEKWEWVEKTEALALSLTTPMRENADGIRQAAAALASLRPGEAAFAEALRKQAALTDARRADAERLLAATRRLQEKEMRRLSAKEHLVSPAMAGFLGKLASRTDSSVDQEGYVPAPEEMAVAAQVEDAAARAVEGIGRVAGRLRRGAAAAVMKVNEEALVDALLRQAVVADTARATIETFAAAVRRFLAAAGGGGGRLWWWYG